MSDDVIELRKKVWELENWKQAAVLVMPDFKELGKLLEVPLGHTVHDKIIPAIKSLQDRLSAQSEELRVAREEIAAHVKFEFCEECNAPLSQCGPQGVDGEPSLDCRVCSLKASLVQAQELVNEWNGSGAGEAYVYLGRLKRLINSAALALQPADTQPEKQS